jgi:hypothetical protein
MCGRHHVSRTLAESRQIASQGNMIYPVVVRARRTGDCGPIHRHRSPTPVVVSRSSSCAPARLKSCRGRGELALDGAFGRVFVPTELRAIATPLAHYSAEQKETTTLPDGLGVEMRSPPSTLPAKQHHGSEGGGRTGHLDHLAMDFPPSVESTAMRGRASSPSTASPACA